MDLLFNLFTEHTFPMLLTFFDFMFLPVNEFISLYSNPFVEFVLKNLTFVGILPFFGDISLGAFFLGTSLFGVLVANIILWFIP